MAKRDNVVWRDRKRWLFGLPWSFTVYELTEERLFLISGLFNKREEEVRLYRILDVSLRRTFGERIFGLGTIHICSADRTTPELDLVRIRDSQRVKDMISDMSDKQRDRKRVGGRELFMDSGEYD